MADDLKSCNAAYQDTVSLPLSCDADLYAGIDEAFETSKEEESHLMNALEKVQ